MTRLPLEGIRVVELAVVWSGPYVCRLLGDWGAEVIKVESRQHFQFHTRGYMPKMPEFLVQQTVGYSTYRKPGYNPDTAHNTFTLFNGQAANKVSFTVDMRTPKGMDVFRRLIEVSDVLVENNSPRIKEKLGISWDVVKQWNPRLIMLSMPGFGGTGLYKDYRAFGVHMDNFVGHGYMSCYLDEEFDTESVVYHADEAGGIMGALAVMMALYQRLSTGKGQYIDLAQTESSACHLGQAIMDYTMNKRITEKSGNRDYHGAVQGCYRCRDTKGKFAGGIEFVDSWINITITNDEEWQGFCRAIGNPAWTKDERFSNSLSRYQNHNELDRLIEEWTINYDNYYIMYALQKEGVPAGPVMDEKDAYSDPHLRVRDFFHELNHLPCGTHLYPGIAWKMSKTPNHLKLPPPCLGEHNEYVYKHVIGVTDEEYAELEREGHIGTDYIDSITFSL
jgi:crotonobetainyl-CoA:carnitine CoA-transferase CaiB-like acyl-CoA transferase